MELPTRDIVPLIDQSQTSFVGISRAGRASRAMNPPPSSSLAEEKRLRSPLLRAAGARFTDAPSCIKSCSRIARSQPRQPANGFGVNVYLVDRYS